MKIIDEKIWDKPPTEKEIRRMIDEVDSRESEADNQEDKE